MAFSRGNLFQEWLNPSYLAPSPWERRRTDRETAMSSQNNRASAHLPNMCSLLFRIFGTLLPSPISAAMRLEHSVEFKTYSETAYLDGIRGLCALIVFLEHFNLPFYPAMFGDTSRVTDSWSLLQLPVIRAIYSGSFAVATFFILSGFALSIKPLSSRNSSNMRFQAATNALASSAFRRGLRLFLPVLVTIFLTAVGANIGVFETARSRTDLPSVNTGHYDLRIPPRLPTIWAQLGDVFDFISTSIFYPDKWLQKIPSVSRDGVYGFHLWTISIEFWSSQLLFVLLLATIRFKHAVRSLIFVIAASYALWCMRWEISLFLAGSIIADSAVDLAISDLDLPRLPSNTNIPRFETLRSDDRLRVAGLLRYLKELALILTFVCGVWLGSMPDFNGDVTPGYQWLCLLINQEPVWHSLGATIVLWSTTYSTALRKFFTLAIMRYLGRISFALYLVHVPIVTSIGWKAVPFIWDHVTGNDTNLSKNAGIIIGCILILLLILWVADLFWRFVDYPSIAFAKGIHEKLVDAADLEYVDTKVQDI